MKRWEICALAHGTVFGCGFGTAVPQEVAPAMSYRWIDRFKGSRGGPEFRPSMRCGRSRRSLGLAVLALLFALCGCAGRAHVRHEVPRLYAADEQTFNRTMGSLLGRGIEGGNRVQALINGEQIFPAMIEAIRHAQHTITFETYIYWSGQTGREFAEALSERARAGVRVHLLVDWVGSGRMDPALLQMMKSAGVEIRKFHPLRWYNLDRMNNRTHRKLLVVDGRIGFTGGVGIADQWRGNAQDPDHWRDSHFSIEGPAVAQMQAVFVDNWIKVSGSVLHGREYFPPLEAAGDAAAQVFSSSPTSGGEHMRLMYLLAITAAKHSIRLSSAYFIPDQITREALSDARIRGVRVQIIVPGRHNDTETTRRASRALWGELLQAGIDIYEYQPTMYHCKMMIVDSRFVSVGSTNFDPRSFALNDEANLNIYDAAFARSQEHVFEQDLTRSRQVSLEAWRSRPRLSKLWEGAATLLAPQL